MNCNPEDWKNRGLPTAAGLDALGEWHLVEIRNAADLGRVDSDSVHRRIEEAKAAFEVIVEYLQSERLDPADRKTLAAIEIREM